MAKLKFEGLEEFETQLLKLQSISPHCVGKAVYMGAKQIADAVKANIEALPIDNRTFVKEGQLLTGITEAQKAGLREGFGVAKMQDENGYIHVKIGFDGYNSVTTKNYPQGQPNAMIARSVNSGTSFRQRIPFVDNAVQSQKAAAEKAMADTFDQVLKENL